MVTMLCGAFVVGAFVVIGTAVFAWIANEGPDELNAFVVVVWAVWFLWISYRVGLAVRPWLAGVLA